MQTTNYIYWVIPPKEVKFGEVVYSHESHLQRIPDQPQEGFRNREIAKQQLKNLLDSRRPPYASGNQFLILETFFIE